MTEEQKQTIIEKGKEYFRKVIIPSHISNLNRLKLKSFNINPFLINYLASFLCGNTEPTSLAKALVYPRILGTSLNTSFGQNIQTFISGLEEVIGGASGIEGIDIEFVDQLDGRRKYCQVKSGPQTINKEDIATILGHFKYLLNKSRLDKMGLQIDDLIVGVLYGEKDNLSANYKAIDSHYPVYCGAEFWERVTGDKDFYYRLAKGFGEVVEEENVEGSKLINKKVEEIAREITEKGGL
ncbi:MAG: PmeII family type II restriction endonuclease [Bacteroidales bacterium]|nr:PmeII family type II restriction endonuclease [Bacteroidales bacterium]